MKINLWRYLLMLAVPGHPIVVLAIWELLTTSSDLTNMSSDRELFNKIFNASEAATEMVLAANVSQNNQPAIGLLQK